MTSEADWELDRQMKFTEMLKFTKNKLIQFQETVSSSVEYETRLSLATNYIPLFASQLDLLLEDSNYLFELSNSKQIMLSENIKYIKHLKQEIKELKLQIP